MRNKQMLHRIVAVATAAVMAGSCVNFSVFAQEPQQDEAISASAIFEMKDYSTASTTSASTNDKAADFTSYGGELQAGESIGFSDVDFSAGDYDTIMLLISAKDDQAGKKIEVHLDSPAGDLLSTITVENTTSDEEAFREHYGTLEAVEGVHDVYFVFPEAANLNFDWFTFSSYDGTETEEERDTRMQWWRDAKYGQFIHWGAYSYLGGEYNGQQSSGYSEWIMNDLRISKEDYAENAAKPFNPTQFDAEAIVQTAKDAGQKYLVFTSRHHEGLSMWDTKVREFKDYSLFSFCNYGNYTGVDPIRELSDECAKQGITFGVYYTIMDWHDVSQDNWGANMDMEQKENFKTRIKAQLRELVEDYGVKVLFFDGEWTSWWTKEDGQELYRYLRTIEPSLIINNRIGKRHTDDGDYGTPEQEIPATGLDYDWESCMTLNGNWGYDKYDNNWKNAETVISNLISCASKGGNFLLNVGPDAEGVVPQQSQDILREAGQWLTKYGDSIYNTQRNCFDKLPSGVQATTKDGKIYLHVTDVDANSTLLIPRIENEIQGIKVMGTDQQLSYDLMKDNIAIDLTGVEENQYDTVIEMDVVGTPVQIENKEVNFAEQATEVSGTNYYQNDAQYAPDKAVDGDENTRWATEDDTTSAQLELTFEEPITVNTAYIKNYNAPNTDNWVRQYSVDYWNGTEWVAAQTGQDMGNEVTLTFDPVTSARFRLNLSEASNPSIYEFQLFNREIIELEITEPAVLPPATSRPEGIPLLETAPYTVSGTSVGGTNVEVTISGNSFTPKTASAQVTEDGSWTVQFDEELAPGNVNIKAALKDADGNTIAIVTSKAILRGMQNLAKGKPVSVSTYYTDLPGFGGDAAVDGYIGTRWSPSDDDTAPVMTINLGEMTTFNQIIISELFDEWTQPYEYRCRSFMIESFDGLDWETIYEGTTVGEELVINLPEAVTGSQVRVSILESRINNEGKQLPANIVEFELYNTSQGETPFEEANKTSLKFYLDKANAVDQEVIDSLVESAQAQFTAALENGQKVYDNAAATQEEVDAAAKELRIALNMLGMEAGNKESLINLIAEAEDLLIDAEGNYPQGAINELQKAIDAAKEVANDGDAFQADVDKAVEDLQDAIEAFNESKLDWRALEAAVADGATIAADIEAGRYVEDEAAFEAFDTAYAAAQELLNSKTADSQEAIDAATTALLEAGSNLRYKADKTTLEAVIGEAENVDVTLYTASSVATFRTALAAANTVLADGSLSTDQQSVVDNATATLEEAMAALVPIETATANGGDNTTGSTTGSTDTAVADGGDETADTITTAKTGDSNSLPIALAAIVLAVGIGFAFRKKSN